MAEPVTSAEGSYGWFAPQDFEFLVERLLRFEERDSVVLVGGQAVTAWAIYYGLQVPATEAPYLTQDADFHATREAAKHLADELGGDLRLSELDDHTINVGTIVFCSPNSGQRLLIDILHSVHGLSSEEIRQLAVPIEVPGGMIRVLHPLLCLKSRIYNLADIPAKRTPEGIAQAYVAMRVVASFLAGLAGQRQRLKAFWRIADLAGERQAVDVFIDYQIDLLQLIDVAAINNPEFRERSWPDRAADIEHKREVALRRRAKLLKGRGGGMGSSE